MGIDWAQAGTMGLIGAGIGLIIAIIYIILRTLVVTLWRKANKKADPPSSANNSRR